MRHLGIVTIITLLITGITSCGSPLFSPTPTRGPSYTIASNSLAFREVWRHAVGHGGQTGGVDAPIMTIAADTIVIPIVGVHETQLVALRTRDGKQLWVRTLDNPGFPDIPVRVMSIVADSKRVYVTLLSFVAKAFDLADGRLLWTLKELQAHTGYNIFPVLQNDTLQIYSTPKDTAIYNVNVTNGQIQSVEEYPRGLIMQTSTFRCFDKVVSLSCVNNSTGKDLWQIPIPDKVQRWPVFINPQTMIFTTAGSTKFIMAVDAASGQIIWQTSGDVRSNLAIVRGVVYSLGTDATLVARDALTGRQMGILQFSNGTSQTRPEAEYWLMTDGSMLFVYLGDSQELIALGP